MFADLSGKWVGTLKTPNGDFPLSYTFKLDGDKLSGTGSAPDGVVPLANCVVKGDDFSFTVPVNGTDIKNTCKYYSAGDSISINIDFNGYLMHSTLKRDTK